MRFGGLGGPVGAPHLMHGSPPHALQEVEDDAIAVVMRQHVLFQAWQASLDRNLRRLCQDLRVGFLGSWV